MNKIRYKYYDIIYLLILLSFILFIFYQYLFTGIIHCDDNTNDIAIFEPLTWYYPSQESLHINNIQNSPDSTRVHDVLLQDQGINTHCITAYAKYREISRRKLYWYSCIKSKGTFNTYEDYKKSWDTNTKVLLEIKKEFKKEIDDELHRVNVIKNTLNWIFRPNTRGGRRGKD
jgi:hypothetical protein